MRTVCIIQNSATILLIISAMRYKKYSRIILLARNFKIKNYPEPFEHSLAFTKREQLLCSTVFFHISFTFSLNSGDNGLAVVEKNALASLFPSPIHSEPTCLFLFPISWRKTKFGLKKYIKILKCEGGINSLKRKMQMGGGTKGLKRRRERSI